MTAQSSSKSFFGTYLKYRLGAMKLNLIMCCILNVLGLPLYALAARNGFVWAVSEFTMFGRVFSMLCIAALPAAAIMNAAVSFDYYNKKDLTDTIGVLPLTHQQRFFADLLAGYITNAAPIIPCGIFCAVMLSGTQAKFEEFHQVTNGACNFRMATVGVVIAVSLFLIVSFAYLFSVLISSCCGKFFHSVIFSVIGATILPLFFGGLARCFANGVVGIDGKGYFTAAVSFFPPIGLLGDLFDAMNVAFDKYTDSFLRAEELYAVCDPIHIVIYVLIAAGLIAGAYFIGKRRLAENTGSAFAVKPMFIVLSAGITAAVTITMLAVTYHSVSLYILISAAVGAAACLVTILLYLPSKKKFVRSLEYGAAAVAAMLGVWFLLNKTGSFGARYLPENSDKIEYVKINYTYTITDKADIEKYISLLNNDLRSVPLDMRYDLPGYVFEVKTTSGKTIERKYSYSERYANLLENLDGYVDYFFDEMNSVSDEWSCRLKTKTTDVEIPQDKTKEFIAILREEASEKHSPNAEKFADVVFSVFGRERRFEIEKDFSRTILFLELLDENVEKDPESLYLHIEYNRYGEEWGWLEVNIPYKNRDNEKVKELVALLEEGGSDVDNEFKIMAYHTSAGYAVKKSNRDRVLELMLEIAAEQISDS